MRINLTLETGTSRFPHLHSRLQLCIDQILGCHVLLQVKGTWTSYAQLNSIIERVVENDPATLLQDLLHSPPTEMLPGFLSLAFQLWKVPSFKPDTQGFQKLCDGISKCKNIADGENVLKEFYALIVHIQTAMLLGQHNDRHLWAFTQRYARGLLSSRTDARWSYLAPPGKIAKVYVDSVIERYRQLLEQQ